MSKGPGFCLASVSYITKVVCLIVEFLKDQVQLALPWTGFSQSASANFEPLSHNIARMISAFVTDRNLVKTAENFSDPPFWLFRESSVIVFQCNGPVCSPNERMKSWTRFK